MTLFVKSGFAALAFALLESLDAAGAAGVDEEDDDCEGFSLGGSVS